MVESIPVYSISHFMESQLAISRNSGRRKSHPQVSWKINKYEVSVDRLS